MRVDDVIAAFGGPEATARLFSVGRSSVSNWKAIGRFPDYLHWRVVKECAARGFAYDPATEIHVRNVPHNDASDMQSSTIRTPIGREDGKRVINEGDENVAETLLPNNLANSDPDTAVANEGDDAAQQPNGCGRNNDEGAPA